MDKKLNIVNSLILSAAITVIFITLVTIVADLQPPLKNWLKNTFTHHWVGKGILAVAIFVVATFLFSFLPFQIEENKLSKKVWALFWISILGAFVIFGFYIYETFFMS